MGSGKHHPRLKPPHCSGQLGCAVATFKATTKLTAKQKALFKKQPDVYKRGANNDALYIIGHTDGNGKIAPCREKGVPRQLVKGCVEPALRIGHPEYAGHAPS